LSGALPPAWSGTSPQFLSSGATNLSALGDNPDAMSGVASGLRLGLSSPVSVWTCPNVLKGFACASDHVGCASACACIVVGVLSTGAFGEPSASMYSIG